MVRIRRICGDFMMTKADLLKGCGMEAESPERMAEERSLSEDLQQTARTEAEERTDAGSPC